MHISIWTKRVVTVTIFAVCAGLPACTSQSHTKTSAAAVAPVNHMCPIGKEPIVASAGTIEYKGETVGFCCPACSKEFLAWPEAQRDEWVALARKGEEPGVAH